MPKNFLEKIAGAPAETLEQTLKASEKLIKKLEKRTPLKQAGHYWHTLGPGLTTGAADDDPSGIATYSQAGGRYGFALLWLAPWTFPLMAVIQEMCARIGLVTGRGLAGNIKIHYSAKVLYSATALLFFANVFNLGADLGAMAKTTQLLRPGLNFSFLVIFFTAASLGLQIYTSYGNYAKYLKWLALILVTYILTALGLQFDGWQVLKAALLPHLSWTKDQIFLVCGVLGTTISPYLFFWQTSQEVEEQISKGQTSIKMRQQNLSRHQIKQMRIDVWSGMFFSNLVMFFIIVTCAGTLYKAGLHNIQSASDAAAALQPLGGVYTYLLFALGVIGTGLLAVPVLAGSASYAISEAFGWKEGLFYKLKQAHAFYGVIIIAMCLGLLMNFIRLDPIKALIYSAVGNGLVAPVILVFIVQISSSKKIMGERANPPLAAWLGWIITALMIIIGVAAIASLFF